MQEQTQHMLKKAVQENSHSVYMLSAQMVQLKVIQGAVARLIEELDEAFHKGWHEDSGTAYLVINEVRDTVRLIDMGFFPLFKEMSKEIKDINIHADAVFDLIIRSKSDQSSNSSTEFDINSKEDWNTLAMESNIKLFIKELGREPESFEEVSTYISEVIERVATGPKKKADAPTSTNENTAD